MTKGLGIFEDIFVNKAEKLTLIREGKLKVSEKIDAHEILNCYLKEYIE
jgi:hypothetical protein